MQDFQAQTILDPVPPSRRMNAAVPQYHSAEVGHFEPSSSNSGSSHPFKLVVETDPTNANVFKYRVLPGTLTHGTNGALIVIGKLDEAQVISAGYVYVKLSIADSALNPDTDTCEIEINDEWFEEVVFSDEEPYDQAFARLLIGKIVQDENNNYIVLQATSDHQRLTYGFLNGKLVLVFELAPAHKDSLVLPE
jgi:hypothetical protein